MNCNETRQHLMLYLDSEGDPELHFRISDHLGMCPDCAEWFARQQRFEQAVNERLAAGEATPELWQSVLSAAGVTVPVAARRRWMALGGALVAAACAVVAVLLWLVPPRGPELAGIAADWHARWASGTLTPELISNSDEEVDRYLKERMPFRVHCPPRKDVNFAVAGAGVQTVKDHSAAYIVGTVDRAEVSILVLARDSLDAFPSDRSQLARSGGRHRCREKNYEMVTGITADNVVIVIGAADPDELEKVLNAYGTYHDAI